MLKPYFIAVVFLLGWLAVAYAEAPRPGEREKASALELKNNSVVFGSSDALGRLLGKN